MRRGSGAGHSAADPQQTARLKTTLEDSGILVQETALSPRCGPVARAPLNPLSGIWNTMVQPVAGGIYELVSSAGRSIGLLAGWHARPSAPCPETVSCWAVDRGDSAPSRMSLCWSNWMRGTGARGSTLPARSWRGCRHILIRRRSRMRSAIALAAWRRAPLVEVILSSSNRGLRRLRHRHRRVPELLSIW